MIATAKRIHKSSDSSLLLASGASALASQPAQQLAAQSVLVIENHPLIRMALHTLLKQHSPDVAIEDCDDGARAIEMVRDRVYDFVLIDLNLSGYSGIELVAEIKRSHPKLPVIAHSMQGTDHYIVQAYANGAWAHIHKGENVTEFTEAFNAVLAGRRYVANAKAEILARYLTGQHPILSHDKLSKREKQVLMLLGGGLTPKEVGVNLGLSIKTVSTYQTRIVSKLGLRVGRDIIRYCCEHGLNNN